MKRVSGLQEQECLVRSRLLEEERRRREEAERRLQDETCHRQLLVEKEVKMRAKNFSQVGTGAHSLLPAGPWVNAASGRWGPVAHRVLGDTDLLLAGGGVNCFSVFYTWTTNK